MIDIIISFLVLLNPFALFLYLQPIWKDLDDASFRQVLFRASAISFGIFIIFLLFGSFIFERILQINVEAFRIFGGVVLFSYAYLFIVRGQGAMIHMKEDLDDLASEIALPFMVGAGTIFLSILMGYEYPRLVGALSILIVICLTYASIILLKDIRGLLEKRKLRIAFDKNMAMLLRLNGFFLGSIGVHMIIEGVKAAF